ncbi:uncharacterized protein [Littorina saxatilis]|uniref:uncharacterized protein n=1 Tax=Littorina saxatilis TaxID=31220 RepID=UPI0038B5D209
MHNNKRTCATGIPAGSNEQCGGTTDCVTDAVCDSRLCKIDVGKGCDPTTNNHCKSSSDCVAVPTGSATYQCRLTLGSQCTNANECKPELLCDVSTSQCRIPAGSNEQCGGTTDCVTDAVCDSRLCKIDVGKGCDPTTNNHCKSSSDCVAVPTGSATYQCSKFYIMFSSAL